MTSVRTFAALVAGGDELDPDLATLAAHASDSIGRIDRHLDRLHEFAALEEAPLSGARTSAWRCDEILSLFAEELAGRDDALVDRVDIASVPAARTAARTSECMAECEHRRFIVATILDEVAARLPDEERAAISRGAQGPTPETLLVTIPNATRAPTEHLRSMAAGGGSSWRILLAALVAARLGESVEENPEDNPDVQGGDDAPLTVRWIMAAPAKPAVEA